ncbi:pentapeptide repeat-containing protein [Kamptonema formosum]|uniref:pentapeptide repeat-containing protein n=1 Tax=Kamptonema formosum TaxID=331992 RepID=UPI000349B039|nr:pentapeptide repeat-containing protein [Oscillatoria sp. PCC 10802]
MSLNVEALERSLERVKPWGDEFAVSFYDNLFICYPEVKPLFAKTEMNKQYKKLVNDLVLVVENLRNPEALGEVFDTLGARDVEYGALAIHYPAVGDALLATFEQYLQEDWTPEVKQAWEDALAAIAAQMLKDAGEDSSVGVDPDEQPASLEEASELKAELKNDAQQLQLLVESQRKPLVSIQWDSDRLQELTANIAEKYQQLSAKIPVNRWGENLTRLPGKVTERYQQVQPGVSENQWGENLKTVPVKLGKTFWKLPAWAVASVAAGIMGAVFWLAGDNSVLAEILEGADAITLVVALVLFIKEAPARRKQFHYQAWGRIDAARGEKVSYARFLALQDLNEDGVSLRGLDAAGAVLAEINLLGVNLSAANLSETDLSYANLSSANLDNANLYQAQLIGANLSHANLSFAALSQVNLSSANLRSAKLVCADLSHANLNGANLSHASLSGANLEGAYLSGANLKDAKVSVDELSGAFLEGAIMPDGSIYQSEKD